MAPEIRRELQRLLSALCDGVLTDAEHARLEDLLAQDAECRRLYLEYADVHAQLLAHPHRVEGALVREAGASEPLPPGPSSSYQSFAPPSSRTVTRLGIPERWANALAYAPFYIGLVASIIELLVVPRNETRTRFHAAQGLALHLAFIAGSLLFKIVGAITDSRLGGLLFSLAAFTFLVVSAIRVWQGKPHHVAPLDDARRWLDEHVPPMK